MQPNAVSLSLLPIHHRRLLAFCPPELDWIHSPRRVLFYACGAMERVKSSAQFHENGASSGGTWTVQTINGWVYEKRVTAGQGEVLLDQVAERCDGAGVFFLKRHGKTYHKRIVSDSFRHRTPASRISNHSRCDRNKRTHFAYERHDSCHFVRSRKPVLRGNFLPSLNTTNDVGPRSPTLCLCRSRWWINP